MESSGPTTSIESSSAMLPRASPLRTDLDLTRERGPCTLPGGVPPSALPRLADRFMLALPLPLHQGREELWCWCITLDAIPYIKCPHSHRTAKRAQHLTAQLHFAFTEGFDSFDPAMHSAQDSRTMRCDGKRNQGRYCT